jgi:hypothetical protein
MDKELEEFAEESISSFKKKSDNTNVLPFNKVKIKGFGEIGGAGHLDKKKKMKEENMEKDK